ncbi:MAG: ATP-binding protein [Syntrophomonas sp.]
MVKKSIQLQIINQITRSNTIEMSFEEMMENISSTLREVIEYDLLSFCIIENNRNLVIKISVPKNVQGLEEGKVIKGHDGIRADVWLVIKQKKYFIRGDIVNDEWTFAEDAALKNQGIRSTLVVPLIVKNQATGTLNLGSNKTDKYDDGDAVFLQQIADHLAVSFENVRLFLEENKAKRDLEDTFKAITDIFYLIDSDYTMIRFNQFTMDFCKSIGTRPEIGKKCYNFFENNEEKCKNCPAKEVLESGKSVFNRSYTKHGRIWDGYAYPIYSPDGKVDQVIVNAKDVTKKAEIESQLIQSAKLADMGIITAGIAHELNSPLTAIIGNALLLEQYENSYSEDQKEMLSDIKKCGLRCRDIISTVRNFARKDSGALEPTLISEVVSDALKLVAYLIEKSSVKLIYNRAPGILMVKGNRQHLEQLVVNLLLNAQDAVRDCEYPCIEISTVRDTENNNIILSVRDNGYGMSQEELPNIFNAFYTTKKISKGTGLGLSICKTIAEEHNGRIEVASDKGRGSMFTFILPEWEGETVV